MIGALIAMKGCDGYATVAHAVSLASERVRAAMAEGREAGIADVLACDAETYAAYQARHEARCA